MEVFNSFVLLLVCTSIFSVAGAWKIVNWAWFRPRKVEKMLRQQGVGGSRYKLLLGDAKEMVSSAKEAESKPIPFTNNFIPRIMPFFSNIVKNHGASSFTWMGPSPALLITNPELMKEVLAKNYVYQKPQNNPLAKLLAEGFATYDTDKWAKHRRIINPAFHLEKLKLMMPAFYLSCTEMLSKWENIASTDGSVELDVWPYFKTMTGDVISRTAFGSNFEEGRKIFELQTEQSDLFEEAIRSIYLPGFRFLPTKRNRRMKENYREVNSLVMSILNKRVKSMQEGEAVGNDLLGILMESNQKAIQEDNNNDKLGMSFEDMIQECKLFYLAGHTTTAILLVWTLILLGKHTDWQARAREEVLHLLGNKKPDFEDLNQLKTVTMILNEVLRIYTPGTMTARRTGQETKLGELSLPKDMMIFLLPILMHHDPEIWGDDAEEFNPERFSEGVSKAPRKGQSTSYIPFSSGPRICIGQNFAMLEAKMAIALILQKFSFETSPLYVHAPRLMLSLLQPQFGAQLILRKL